MALIPILSLNSFVGATPLRWDACNSGAVADGTHVRTTPSRLGMYSVNGGFIRINETSTAIKTKINRQSIDVNFANLECGISSVYPSPIKQHDEMPIKISFDRPVSAVGAHLAIIGQPQIYDGRRLNAILWATLQSDNGDIDKAHAVWGEGFSANSSSPLPMPQPPFVGAQAPAGELIEHISFDASIVAAFDYLAISTLYWRA